MESAGHLNEQILNDGMIEESPGVASSIVPACTLKIWSRAVRNPSIGAATKPGSANFPIAVLMSWTTGILSVLPTRQELDDPVADDRLACITTAHFEASRAAEAPAGTPLPTG
jgi:hypothetical protein